MGGGGLGHTVSHPGYVRCLHVSVTKFHQIGKLTSTPCFTKSAFFRVSGERGAEEQGHKMDA